MARISTRPSTTLLGRTKLQAVATAPVKPVSPLRPTRVPRPRPVHRASIRDFL